MRLPGFDAENRTHWVLLALLLATGWSLSGLIFRLIDYADAPQIVFYRGLSLSIFLLCFVVMRYRRGTIGAFRAIGRPGWIAGASLGIATVFFLYAITHTTIANVSFVNASTPFIAAGLGWIALREAVARHTIAACSLAAIGVAIMVWEGVAVGNWFGNLAALAAASLSACYAVALRRGGGVDMMPAVVASGFIAALVSVPLMGDFAITWHDLGLAALQGIAISAVCNVAFTYCARHIPAAELTLLSMIESVLSPFWVWLAIGETPYGATIVGGAVVLAAVGFEAVWPLRRHLIGRTRTVD